MDVCMLLVYHVFLQSLTHLFQYFESTIPSTRVGYRLPAVPGAHQHQQHTASLPHVRLQKHCSCPVAKYSLIHWEWSLLPACNSPVGACAHSTLCPGVETVMQEPRQVAMVQQEAGCAVPATKFVLTCYITYVKTQHEIYSRFPAIRHKIYPRYIIPSLFDVQSMIYYTYIPPGSITQHAMMSYCHKVEAYTSI